VYAIDPTSEPSREGRRIALNATSTPISLSLAFPESASKVDYVAPAVAAIEVPYQTPDLGDYEDE